MSLKRLYRHMNREIDQIDQFLSTRVRTDHPVIESASRQLLDAGGKRIRPAFVLLSAGFGETSQSKLVFTDHGINVPRDDEDITELTLEDLPEAQARWTKRAKAMMTDEVFVPRPNFLCRYCPYSCNVGGPCEY